MTSVEVILCLHSAGIYDKIMLKYTQANITFRHTYIHIYIYMYI